jgi:hypothetical protein
VPWAKRHVMALAPAAFQHTGKPLAYTSSSLVLSVPLSFPRKRESRIKSTSY